MGFKKQKDNSRFTIAKTIIMMPVGDKEEVDRVYKYLREHIESQNKALNLRMTAMYTLLMQEADKDVKDEASKLYARIGSSPKGSAFDEDLNLSGDMMAQIKQKVDNDLTTALKKGLKFGVTSLPSYNKSNPLLVRKELVTPVPIGKRHQGLYHNYDSHEGFLQHLYKSDLELFIRFMDDITFKIILGVPYKTAELRSVFKKIFEGEYIPQGSSIGIKDDDIVLHLSLSIPKYKPYLDENVVAGVDVGMAIPAVCALNNNSTYSKFCGYNFDLVRTKTQIQKQRQRAQSSAKYAKGGHGRKRKLACMDRFREKEKNFAKTYNHKIAKEVVQFALDNHAKYINIEDLSGIGKEQRKSLWLGSWTYFQLQEFIRYKAEEYGIVVRKVDPAYTSQTCSCCGHTDEKQRASQSEFICNNPKCKNFNKTVNADYNAARNIAMSTKFVDEETKKKKKKKRKKTNETPASNSAIAVA